MRWPQLKRRRKKNRRGCCPATGTGPSLAEVGGLWDDTSGEITDAFKNPHIADRHEALNRVESRFDDGQNRHRAKRAND